MRPNRRPRGWQRERMEAAGKLGAERLRARGMPRAEDSWGKAEAGGAPGHSKSRGVICGYRAVLHRMRDCWPAVVIGSMRIGRASSSLEFNGLEKWSDPSGCPPWRFIA
jgi:hypothetical protein